MKTEPSELVKVIDFWLKAAQEKDLKNRSLVESIDLKTKEIVDIIGPRRSGKSSILKLLIKRLDLKNNFLFINFEDPFFIEHQKPHIIDELIAVYKEYFHPKIQYLFFDEIQNINQWEKAICKLRESSEFKVYITGSSSKLLSSEMASLLTGRHISYKLMPLSFSEYLQFKRATPSGKKDVLLKEKALLKYFSEYLSIGAFPEIVLTGDRELTKQYFFDIIQKDIIMRHDVREKVILEKMAVYLLTNATKTISIESLKKTFDISYELASSYLDYFKESFLLFELPQFSYSLKTQQKALKKFYAVDCGLAGAVSFRFSEDKGRMLDNCAFLHLKEKWDEIYYYKTKRMSEVDFLVRNGKKAELIQIAWSLRDKNTRDREVRSLVNAMDELNLEQGYILTYDEEDKIDVGKKRILVKAIYKWLLEAM